MRRIDSVPWWSMALAHLLFRRERRALAVAGKLGVAPPLLSAERRTLVRGWIDGVALHIAKPQGDAGYFRSAKVALRKLHCAGVTHNDLAKEQNWLYADGRAYVTDFQFASCFPLAAAPSSASRATRICATCSSTSAATRPKRSRRRSAACWGARAGSRGFGWRPARRSTTSSRAASTRPTAKAAARVSSAKRPAIAERLRTHPQVRDVADRRLSRPPLGHRPLCLRRGQRDDRELSDFLGSTGPEHLQIVDALPRNAQGEVRNEILQLVALNQLDLIASLVKTDSERALVAHIVSGRRNLRDRFAF